jgi:hypothetical protein
MASLALCFCAFALAAAATAVTLMQPRSKYWQAPVGPFALGAVALVALLVGMLRA